MKYEWHKLVETKCSSAQTIATKQLKWSAEQQQTVDCRCLNLIKFNSCTIQFGSLESLNLSNQWNKLLSPNAAHVLYTHYRHSRGVS